MAGLEFSFEKDEKELFIKKKEKENAENNDKKVIKPLEDSEKPVKPLVDEV